MKESGFEYDDEQKAYVVDAKVDVVYGTYEDGSSFTGDTTVYAVAPGYEGVYTDDDIRQFFAVKHLIESYTSFCQNIYTYFPAISEQVVEVSLQLIGEVIHALQYCLFKQYRNLC